MGNRTDFHRDGEPCRVLFLDNEKVWRGGQDSLYQLLRGLARTRVRTWTMARSDGGLARRLADTDWNWSEWDLRSEFSIGEVRRLRTRILEFRPHILFYNTPKTVYTGLAAAWTTRRRVVHLGIRRVDMPLRRNILSQWKWKRYLDHVVAISTAIRGTLLDFGLESSRISVIHPNLNLVEFDAIQPASDEELETVPGFGIFCMSAFTREKGVDVLIRAFAAHGERFPESTLVLAGTGSLESDYRQLAESEGIAHRVRFLGFRPDVLGVRKRMDALVVPSFTEGFGRAVLYGLAAEKPVIASRVGGILDQIVDGQSGRLVEPGDEAALSAALDEMRADPETAGRMAAAGRDRVVSRFTDEQIIGQYVELFHSLTSSL